MRKSGTKRRLVTILAVFLVVGGYVSYALLRPLPAPTISLQSTAATPAETVSLPLPSYGQSAVGAVGYGVLATHGEQKTFPIASVAKVLTALSVLHQKPLAVGEQGPTLTLTPQDVQFYQNYVAIDGSVVPVTAGEQITEYQALQAMLLPSANNMAQTLATWAFGSEAAYAKFADDYARQLGMTNTSIADASGFSPSTTSSASDLVKLGLTALGNPVIADIVNQSTATIPGAGIVHNVNILLGTANIVGIKTGNTDQAGGCFLAASNALVDGQTVKVVTAIEGAPDLGTALHDSVPLVAAMPAGFAKTTVTRAGQSFGKIHTVWGASAAIVAQKNVAPTRWRGQTLTPTFTTKSVKGPLAQNSIVGDISLGTNGATYQTNLITQTSLKSASVFWRLTRPY